MLRLTLKYNFHSHVINYDNILLLVIVMVTLIRALNVELFVMMYWHIFKVFAVY